MYGNGVVMGQHIIPIIKKAVLGMIILIPHFAVRTELGVNLLIR